MNGIVVVDKPEGFTSFDVVAKLRGILKERKLGHGGTLDPMATGVLPVFIGQATKAVDLLPDTTKRYTATVQLGIATDTGDRTGTVTETDDAMCGETELRGAIAPFMGVIEQIPPMYSAVKINGRRLYQIARAGETVARKPRKAEIFRIELLRFDADNRQFTIDVTCSKGTYIRTLAEDIARAAGCAACLHSLRRTHSAGFAERDAFALGHIEHAMREGAIESVLTPIDRVFASYPRVQLDTHLQRLYLNGVAFDAARTEQTVHEKTAVAVYGGTTFLGLAVVDNGLLKKTKQFVTL